jgi:hypothetical protein
MPAKLTQEQVEAQAQAVGLELLEQFINTRTKVSYRCHCGKIFECKPNSIQTGRTTSCGCYRRKSVILRNQLTQDMAKQLAEEAGFKLLGQYEDSQTKALYQCWCGNTFMCRPSSIHRTINRIKSCGHCNDPKIGDQIGPFTIDSVLSSPTGGCRVNATCRCGHKLLNCHPSQLMRAKTQISCGFCNKPEIGNKINNLTIANIHPNTNGGGYRVDVKCECGGVLYNMLWSAIQSGNNQSCGNCDLLRNGVRTSYIALRLHDKIDPCRTISQHNHKIVADNNKIVVDIALIHSKIVVEYDEWYWHRHKQEHDDLRTQKLLRAGWKVLSIKASNDLPTQQQLDKALFDLIMTDAKQKTITLPGWKKKNAKPSKNDNS